MFDSIQSHNSPIIMTVIIGRQFFASLLFLLYRIVSTNEDYSDLFFVRPGDGEEYVYSPVNVNATLHCAVKNTNLAWVVDMLALDSAVQRPQLNSRGIFQSGPIVPSDGVTSSSVIVFGSRELNNNTRICCQSFVNELKENCTTLIVYGKVNTFLPSIQYTGNYFDTI